MMGTGYVNYWGEAWDSSWQWSTKFAWLPARMDSGKFIWFKEYYHGVRIIHGPGTPVILNQFQTPEEYLFNILKQS